MVLTRTRCPKCDTDLTPFQSMSTPPLFCLECRFPLLLLAGKYQLETLYGEGGYGRLYLARHVQLRRNAERMIKVLKPECFKNQTTIHRFSQEIQLTSELSQHNDHFVRIYDDFGWVEALGYFYVMEFLEGALYSDILEQQKRCSLSWLLPIFRQLCTALQYAHDRGVVHRDLKPTNIMLCQRKQEQNHVKILDLGIAHGMSSLGRTHLGMTMGVLGSPLYMAPEQALNLSIDGRTDLYAIALLFYRSLTGIHPILSGLSGEIKRMDVIAAHITHEIPPMISLCPELDIPDAVEIVIRKALEKEMRLRHASVQDFWEALERAATLESSTALVIDMASTLVVPSVTEEYAIDGAWITDHPLLPVLDREGQPPETCTVSSSFEGLPAHENLQEPEGVQIPISSSDTKAKEAIIAGHKTLEPFPGITVQTVSNRRNTRILRTILGGICLFLFLWFLFPDVFSLTIPAAPKKTNPVVTSPSQRAKVPEHSQTAPKKRANNRWVVALRRRELGSMQDQSQKQEDRESSPEQEEDDRPKQQGRKAASVAKHFAGYKAQETNKNRQWLVARRRPVVPPQFRKQPDNEQDKQQGDEQENRSPRQNKSTGMVPGTEAKQRTDSAQKAKSNTQESPQQRRPSLPTFSCPAGRMLLEISSCVRGHGVYTITVGDRELSFPGQRQLCIPVTRGVIGVERRGCRGCFVPSSRSQGILRLVLKDDKDANMGLAQGYCLSVASK